MRLLKEQPTTYPQVWHRSAVYNGLPIAVGGTLGFGIATVWPGYNPDPFAQMVTWWVLCAVMTVAFGAVRSYRLWCRRRVALSPPVTVAGHHASSAYDDRGLPPPPGGYR